jgi:hypothetical protein
MLKPQCANSTTSRWHCCNDANEDANAMLRPQGAMPVWLWHCLQCLTMRSPLPSPPCRFSLSTKKTRTLIDNPLTYLLQQSIGYSSRLCATRQLKHIQYNYGYSTFALFKLSRREWVSCRLRESKSFATAFAPMPLENLDRCRTASGPVEVAP